MTTVTLNDILVELAKIETKQDAMLKKLDDLSKVSDEHWRQINELNVKVQLLEQRQPPRVHPTVWVLAAIAVLGFIASFVTFVIN